MHPIVAVPAVIAVMAAWALPFKLPFGLGKSEAKVQPDTLPPTWKHVSRLGVENQFVRAALPRLEPRPGLKLQNDPRRLRVSVDPDSGSISTVPEIGDVPAGFATRQSLETQSREMARASFRRQWVERSASALRIAAAQTTGSDAGSLTQGLSLRFPSPLPKRIQSFLGPGGPAITVSGSENIRLSGQSNWTNEQVGPLGRKNSLFPSLDMQQDLDIRLEGQLSDRIRINLLQNTGVQIPLANRLAINYKGDEDDLVQALDLGNTSLSLPGTQYVSYSGRNEGLFGAKSTLKMGPLDFTLLASKQEGRSERASYAGGSASQNQTIADLDYIKGQYFLLYMPNETGSQMIEDTTLTVYLDDYRFDTNTGNKVRGRAMVDPSDDSPGAPGVRGDFRVLNPGADQDYELLDDFYGDFYKVIKLRTPISGEQTLAVTYTAAPVLDLPPGGAPVLGPPVRVGGTVDFAGTDSSRVRMKIVRPPVREVKQNTSGFFNDSLPLTRVRELELKNIYQLAGQNIDLSSLKFVVRHGVDEPPVTFLTTPASGDTAIPYLEALGLDNFDESVGSNVRGHDGQVDGTILNVNSRLWVDPGSGTLFFYDLRPFAPRVGPAAGGAFPFDSVLDRSLLRRARLTGPPGAPDEANVAIYDQYILQRAQDARYYMDLQFTAQRAVGEINLGRGNIIEGSDVVMINNVPLVRDRDYTIDYDLGRVTLKRQFGPADNLSIDYAYAPLFQQAGRTLLGGAFKLEGRDRSLGGAFMYESKGAIDLRPRLGEEPSRSLIADLNTDLTFRPAWMTRLVDRLPGVRTTAPSDMRVQAEVGASFPNPNTRGEVYVDDMEGVRDAVSASMGRERWRLSSIPLVRRNGFQLPVTPAAGHYNGELKWYSPPSAVEERDLKPLLTEAQGARNKRQVLALSVPRRPLTANNDPSNPDTLWAGLTFPLDNVGLDLSRAQFIELWVNDFNDHHEGFPRPRVRGRNVRLHVDLGVVSEDQQRSPDVAPNDTLDTEDQVPRDGQLSVTESDNEDTGVEGRLSAEERAAGVPIRDLSTANATDPEGDDFGNVLEDLNGYQLEDVDPRKYWLTNGTEGNKNVDPIPDTEDLNLSNRVETDNDYFEWTIDLGDTADRYLVTDVRRDFPQVPLPNENGWRRYRIPIADSLRVQFGLPNLGYTRHIRIWMDGILETDESITTAEEVRRPFLMLGGIDIVGSRWLSTALTVAQRDSGTTMTLNSVNSVDNADIYVPPFDPGRTRSGSQELARREQSIALEFRQLAPDDTLEAFKTFSLDENYSRYGTLAWHTATYEVDGFAASLDTLWSFVRFASDELGRNYYEYKTRVQASSTAGQIAWDNVELALTTLSNLKLQSDFPTTGDVIYRVAGPRGQDSLIVRGRPSFTRLRRVSFGLVNPPSGRRYASGQLWFDELRSKDVAKDQGQAQRVTVLGNLSNLVSYNMSWDGRDEDFVTVGQSRGSGNRTGTLTAGGTFHAQRFFEATGIIMPVSVGYGQSMSSPRYTAGDDVVRTGALAEASVTRQQNRSFSTSYTRQWSERSNPLLRYTIGGVTAGFRHNTNDGVTPSGVSRGRNSALDVGYGIALRSLWMPKIPLTRLRLAPLPERLYWNYQTIRNETQSFQRTPDGAGLVPSSSSKGRTAFVNFGGDFRPVDILHHHFEGVRNLMLGDLNHSVGPVNVGRVITWRQNMDARHTFRMGPWLSPTLSWNSLYTQDNRPELSPDLSVRAIANGQSMSASWALPFDRLRPAVTPGGVAVPARRDTGVADTLRRTPPRRSFSVRDLLSRIGPLTAEASFNRSSSYSRLVGIPSFLYLVGVSDNPGFEADSSGRMIQQFGNNVNLLSDWRGAARTRMNLGLEALLHVRADISARRNEVNSVVSRSIQSRFPDVEVEYGRVANVARLDRLFQSPRLRTAYNRSQLREYRGGDTPTGISTNSSWSPLISLDGDLRNRTRVGFKIERRITQRENFQLGHSIATERNTDINLSLSRSYSKGQKVKIFLRETTVRTSVNLGLTGVFSRRTGETRIAGESKSQFPIAEDRLSLNATGSYSFSSNVTGNLQLGFGQRRDLVREIIQRNVRVEVRASFNF